MKNASKVNAEALAAGADDITSGAAPATAQILQVKPGIVSRGARQAWYALALAYNGKPVADFMAAAAAHGAVSTYTARSKHAGTPHSAQGYLRGLVRRGWVTLV
jgi:hypothetical protein